MKILALKIRLGFCITVMMAGLSSLQAHELAPVTTLYTTVISTAVDVDNVTRSNWRFWREEDSLEIYNLNTGLGELWQKDSRGKIGYSWFHHGEQFAINYEAVDLQMLGRVPDWHNKGSLINPALLESLSRTGEGQVLSYATELYEGEIAGVEFVIEWLPEFSLPAKVLQRQGGHQLEIVLLEIYALADSPWQTIDTFDYSDMDFTDTGENEPHPMVLMHMQSMATGTAQAPVIHQH